MGPRPTRPAAREIIMGKSIIFAVVALTTCGCQGFSQRIDAGSVEDRLAAIESNRLREPDDASAHDWFGDMAAPTEDPAAKPLVLTNRPAPRSVRIAVARDCAIRSLSRPLVMADLGEAPQEGESTEHVELADSTSSTDGYTRSSPLASFWDTVKRDVKSMPSDLWRDTKRVYANPVNLIILGGTLGGSIAIKGTGVDRSIEHHFNRRNDFQPPHHHMKEDWRDAFGAIGNPGTHFALAGLWYLIGQQSMDDKTYEVGKTLFSALMINGLTVVVGQAASYDRAPNGERGTLPSGHTSSSFVVASVLHQAYGHAVGVPLYALATLVAHERLEDREHYFSDVVMGGVLGLVVGHSVASGRDPEFFGWKILPYASTQGGAGVAFVKTLD
ncbi:MAG: hypothetical protein B6D36_00985 [Planctomycetes bacterium UTPLA1]|nr:MAG: hypothetical protein B6D36_00985 [Planctomycetes bacterium UTPLA1]